MPADIVNLNKFRKAKARAGKEKRAEENRAKFGQSKHERAKAEDDQARRDKLLDASNREDHAAPGKDGAPDDGLDPESVS